MKNKIKMVLKIIHRTMLSSAVLVINKVEEGRKYDKHFRTWCRSILYLTAERVFCRINIVNRLCSGLRTCRRSRPCKGLCTEVRTSFFPILKHKTKKLILGLQASLSKCLLVSSGPMFSKNLSLYYTNIYLKRFCFKVFENNKNYVQNVFQN